MGRKLNLSLITVLSMVMGLWFLCQGKVCASTGCQVLLYYVPGTCNGTDAVTNVIGVLQSAGANVTTIGVCSATYDPTGDNWASYNQVWDMRFVPTNVTSCSGTAPSTPLADDLNSNWQTVATAYLNSGGSFMLNGENAAFFSRSTDNMNFLISIGAVSNTINPCTFNTAQSNGYATLGTPIACTLPGAAQFEGFAVGGIPAGLIGLGTGFVDAPLADWNVGPARDVVVGWSGSAQMPNLTGGSTGMLITVWDTTMWSAGYYTTYSGVVNTFFTSVYTWLGGSSCLATNTMTSSPTPMITNTQTATGTVTATETQTQTVTATQTQTNTASPTGLATNTMTSTATASTTPTMTNTPTISPTSTNSPTFTPTITPTPGLYAWPNPFDPQTSRDHVFKIGYVSQASHLAFYTVSGELVIDSASGGKNLQYGTLPAPEDSGWMWTGANSNGLYVATGIYYYILQKGTGNSGSVLLNGKVLVVNGQ